MADKAAKSHTQQSNRKHPRKAGERKVVFKSVLDNPFRIRWPPVPLNLQNVVFSHLISLLEGVSVYHDAQRRASRKRKRELNMDANSSSKKTKPNDDVVMSEPSKSLSEAVSVPVAKPDVLNHLICGINAVTKRLEAQARKVRRITVMPSKEEDTLQSKTPISLIFVCRADVDPPILIDHFPPLVAACNSVHTTHHIKIVPLPKDSEVVLADKLGLRRASVIALDAQYAGLADFAARLESVSPLKASWLALQANSKHTLVPTHVKQLRTSAPKDMKAAKEARIAGKLAANLKKQNGRKHGAAAKS